MKRLRLVFRLALACVLTSCLGKTEKKARFDCFQGQLGVYLFDTNQTVNWRDFVVRDSARVENFLLTFNPDSTFSANMQVTFLDDTCGHWDAGTCGFENWGEISFKNNPHVIRFAVYDKDSNGFCLIGQNRGKDGEEYIWFKRQ